MILVRMKRIVAALLCMVGCNLFVWGQHVTLSGRLLDRRSGEAVIGASVVVSAVADSSKKLFTTSGADGSFEVAKLGQQQYRVVVQVLGYKRFEQMVDATHGSVALGELRLQRDEKRLQEVAVVGQAVAATQKGDTTEMNAGAYKTNKDATAEDLVQKMPSVSVDQTGTVSAQGETVQKVLVDGKPFFGDDPTVALRNLPAELIDKVQIYNEQSEQSRLSGFDDGNSSKTMNIVTKKNSRNGLFGKAFAGYGTNNTYSAGESLHFFNGDRRVSLISMANNVNQQNFSPQDLIGGGGGKRGGGGGSGGMGGSNANFMTPQQAGISKTNSIGINYSDVWAAKLKISASYFFNNSTNDLQQYYTRRYFNQSTTEANDTSRTRNNNHRLNVRFEYEIDSLNSLMLTPRASFQSNKVSDTSRVNDSRTGQTNSSTTANSDGYNLSNELVFRHRFLTKGRSVSSSVASAYNYKSSSQLAVIDSLDRLADSLKPYSAQKTSNRNTSYSNSVTLMYTEPLGTASQLQVNYTNSLSHTEAELLSYNALWSMPRLDTAYSNIYSSNYVTNAAGLGYRLQSSGFSATLGMQYQMSNLAGNTSFPESGTINRSFKNWLPMLMFRYKMDKRNLFIRYKTSTSAPGIGQLQEVVTLSGLPNLSIGNPYLAQEYNHSLQSRFSVSNSEKSTNFFMFINGGYTRDAIGTAQFTAGKDSLVRSANNETVLLKKGARLSIPQNFDHSWQSSLFVNYGFPVKKIKSNLNLNCNLSYNLTPAQMDQTQYFSRVFAVSPGAVLSSNISEKLDFSILYFGGYNTSSTTVSSIAGSSYFSHTAGVKCTWTIVKGIVLGNEVSNKYYHGLSSNALNQNYVLWNASIAKKLFASQRGEIKISIYDLLNKNSGISRTTTSTYYQDTRSNVLQRYALLTFTYNFRQFKRSEDGDDGRRFRRDGGADGPPPPGDRPPHDRGGFDGPPPPPPGGGGEF